MWKIGCVLALVAAGITVAVWAQPKAAEEKKEVKAAAAVAGDKLQLPAGHKLQLPRFWEKLKLRPDQIDKLEGLRDQINREVAALERTIRQEKLSFVNRAHHILSEEQKEKLERFELADLEKKP